MHTTKDRLIVVALTAVLVIAPFLAGMLIGGHI
jgi:hypothetical protein